MEAASSSSASAPAPDDRDDGEEDDLEDDGEAEAAAERLMLSVQRAFAAAKAKGVPAATRLMKELRQVCASGNGVELEVRRPPAPAARGAFRPTAPPFFSLSPCSSSTTTCSAGK